MFLQQIASGLAKLFDKCSLLSHHHLVNDNTVGHAKNHDLFGF